MKHGCFEGRWTLHDAKRPGEFLLMPHGFRYITSDGMMISIIEPLVTDGASVPRILRWTVWLDPFGSFREAAFIHDSLWEIRYFGGNKKASFFWSNKVLREAAVCCGLKTWQAWLVWLAVTIGGWPWWIWGKKQRAAARDSVDQAKKLRKAMWDH